MPARDTIAVWLAAERGLQLEDPGAPAKLTSAPTTFLGYRVSRSGCAPGPKAKRRLWQRLREAHRMEHDDLVRRLATYRGVWLTLR